MKERKLTEKELKKKQLSLDEVKVQAEALRIQSNSMKAMIEIDLPQKKAKTELAKMEEQLERFELDIKIIERQIKEKKEVYLE